MATNCGGRGRQSQVSHGEAADDRRISNSYTAPVARPRNCPVGLTRIHGRLEEHLLLKHSSIFPVPISLSKAAGTCRNVEFQREPCKPHFWPQWSIRPLVLPVALLQLLVGLPDTTGNFSGNSGWALCSSFSFSATASLVSGEDSAKFSLFQDASSTPQLKLSAQHRNKGKKGVDVVTTECEVLQ